MTTHPKHNQPGGVAAAPADDRALTLATERRLRAPLAALRVLLEGARGRKTDGLDAGFADRAIEALEAAEQAALDLVAWTSPRSPRIAPATLAEVCHSMLALLNHDHRGRVELAVDDAEAGLQTDARMLVEALVNVARERISAVSGDGVALMVHAHADDALATISLVDASEATGDPTAGQTVAEALLAREIHRLGGRASIHENEGHRCSVIVVPRVLATRKGTEVAA